MNPTSRRLASGIVSLVLGCGAHISILNFFESGLKLNPHNKCHSFGLFICLYLCCVVDCINGRYAWNFTDTRVLQCLICFILLIASSRKNCLQFVSNCKCCHTDHCTSARMPLENCIVLPSVPCFNTIYIHIYIYIYICIYICMYIYIYIY